MTEASLVVIGTELTRGIIQDKHGQLVSKELTHLGIHMSQIVALPDDGSVSRVLGALKKNNDILIITGGLGPTKDDMTRSVIADVFGTVLEEREECVEFLKSRLGERAKGANMVQALIPRGFTVLDNPNGTAPGFSMVDPDGCSVYCLPGPPREMEPMFRNFVLPSVRRLLDIPEPERDEYSTFILAEARLEELCEMADPGLDWGTRFQDYRISLYVSGGTKERRDEAIRKLREWSGEYRILDGNVTALGYLTDILRKKGLTVSTAESCTAGLLSSLLTSIGGSSAWFEGGISTYATRVKHEVLGVSAGTIEKYGVVSSECAREMAENAKRMFSTDTAVSVTGVAGPDSQEGKPVGEVHIGVAAPGMETVGTSLHINSVTREGVRRRAAAAAFLLLAAALEGKDPSAITSSWKNT